MNICIYLYMHMKCTYILYMYIYIYICSMLDSLNHNLFKLKVDLFLVFIEMHIQSVSQSVRYAPL